MRKKTERSCVFLQKNETFLRSVLCKRMLRSFVSHKLPKTREKNGTFFFKKRKRMERTDWKRMRCPTLSKSHPCFWIELLTKYLIEEKCCFLKNKKVPNYSTLLCKGQYFELHVFLLLNYNIRISDSHGKQFSNTVGIQT